MRMIAQGQGYDGLLIDPSYCDVSHFLRDANRFLGMTPRRFSAMNTPFLRASVQARAAWCWAAPTSGAACVRLGAWSRGRQLTRGDHPVER